MSVSDKALPTDNDFKIFAVGSPTLGFLDLAATALPINGAATLIAVFKNLSQALWVSRMFHLIHCQIHYLLNETA